MKYRKQNKTNQTYGLGFYFFDDPNTIRESLLEVIEAFAACCPEPFSRWSETGDTFKGFSKSRTAIQFFRDRIERHDFVRSLFLMLSNADRENAPTQRILLWGRTLLPEYKSKTPNYLYFELPVETDVETRWRLFQFAFRTHNFYLGLGNVVMSIDDDSMPQSGSLAARAVRDSDYLLHTFDGTFRNFSYLDLLKRKTSQFLIHPSQFVGVGESLLRQLSDIRTQSIDASLSFHDVRRNHILYKAETSEELWKISQALSPFYGDVSRPDLFWKSDEWDKWVRKAKASKMLL